MHAGAQEAFQGDFPGDSRKQSGLKIAMRWCPPGTFVMGSPEGEPGREHDEVQHRVTLTHGFWLAETEVTQGQWKAVMARGLRDQARLMLADETLYRQGGKDVPLREVMKGDGPGDVASVAAAEAPNVPIYYVSWQEATEFCQKLTERERSEGRIPDGWAYKLPTEAQWEYACRAGTTEATYAGAMEVLGENNAPILNEIAWYGGNSSRRYGGRGWTTKNWPNQAFPGKIAGPRRVGQLKANAWGLKDTLGNLWEWVEDFSAYYPEGDATDPTGPRRGTQHPYRGGSWNHYAIMCRAARRFEDLPTFRTNWVGFRVALARIPEP